jgi:regulator of extracellular matrix RemA (YlzA/DUF370 family)
MSITKELRTILYNHRKLISMISDKSLPIKNMLLKDVQDMNQVIECANIKKELFKEKK